LNSNKIIKNIARIKIINIYNNERHNMIRKIEFDEIDLLPKLSGKELKKLRIYCGVTQYELSKQAGGTSRSMACAWEKKLIVTPYQIKILKDMVEPEIYLSALRILNKLPLEGNG
jgi:hypothetical protein